MAATPPTDTPPAKAASSLGPRLLSTVVLLAVMLGAIKYEHAPTLLAIATIFGLGGAWEYAAIFRHTDVRGAKSHAIMVIVAALVWWLIVWLQAVPHVPQHLDALLMFLSLQAAFLLCYHTDVQAESSSVLRRILSSVFGVLYTVVFFGYVVRILLLGHTAETDHIHGAQLLLYVMLVTKFSDIGAYCVGSFVGSSNYMCPKISPKKTWEGFGGAFLGGFAASSTFLWLMPGKLYPLTWNNSLYVVPVIVLLAVSGDLAESILKRCVQVKDAGHKLPGIGGILDLTDSLLYTAPAFYAWLVWTDVVKA